MEYIKRMFASREKLWLTISVNLCFVFTLIIFGPYEIFISNTNDFSFTFRAFWWMPVLISVVYLAAITGIFMLLPERWNILLNFLIFIFTVCCYIQAMFLNGKMKSLIGEEVNWSSGTKIGNLVIWLVIALAVFLLWRFAQEESVKLVKFVSSALVIMQVAGLVFLLMTTDALTEEKDGYLSTEGMMELAADNNVVVFILDFFDGRYMDQILEERPDMLDPLKGFTYFPNASSVHSRTYPSISYLLTGEICYFDQRTMSFLNSAFSNSQFLPALFENQIDVGLYTFDSYLGNSVKSQIHNYVSAQRKVKFWPTLKYLAEMVLYRDLPYMFKEIFAYEAYEINGNVVRDIVEDSGEEIPAYRNFKDEWFADTIEKEGLKVAEGEGTFRFYHLGSCHLNLSDPIPSGMRSLEIVYEYMEQMKELGVYNDSTIIITADHGESGGGESLDLPQKTAAPIFFVKPSGAGEEPMKISSAPVSHTDFIPTILEGYGLDYKKFGNSVFDIKEDENRERYYYYSALYSDEEGEVELREYRIKGDARQRESYSFTGNKWPILYSQNKVAGQ